MSADPAPTALAADRSARRLGAVVGDPHRAQLTGRRRILEHLELLEVAVRMAAALQKEMALPKGAGPTEEDLGPMRSRCTRGLIERWAQRRHPNVAGDS